MSVDVLVIDAFGPLLHRATGRAAVGASALLRRAAQGPWGVAVTDLRGAGDVADSLVQAGVDVPDDVQVVAADAAGSSPVDRVRGVAEAADVHPAQTAAVVSTPWASLATIEAGGTAVAVAKEGAAETLQQSGVRGRYDDAAALADDLDAAIARCAPRSFSLTPDRLHRLMGEALAEAANGAETGEIPIGSTLVDAEGAVIGRGHNAARATGRPTAHAEMEAIADAARRNGRDFGGAAGLVLVTTLEPCAMCLGAALETEIDAIVYALEAPDNGAIGRCTPNRGPGAVHPRVVGGVCRSESLRLLQEWHEDHPESGFAGRLLQQVTS